MTMTAAETVRKEIFVEASPETAFRVFTEQIGAWWPLDKYGIFIEDAESVTFDDSAGRRLVERATDGRVAVWGEVLEYEFASRMRMTWHPGRTPEEMPTEIEVTFMADGDGTLVVLEHSGWEKIADGKISAARRANYDAGWSEVLEKYRAAA